MTDLVYRRILVPIEGSPCSHQALAHAVAIARGMGSTVVCLYVMDTLAARREGVVNIAEALEALRVKGGALLDDAERTAVGAGVRTGRELLEGNPAEVILRLADEFDLVVMGSHGKGLFERITVGSVTHAVLRHIERPLLIVRAATATG